VLTVALYAFFLVRQMGPQARSFREVDTPEGVTGAADDGGPAPPIRTVLATHRSEVLLRLGLLVAPALPIVLLSHEMAALLGCVRAGLQGQVQTVSNMCAGELGSSVGLTIPSAHVLGALPGGLGVLSGSPADLLHLVVRLLLTATSFLGPRVRAAHGAWHLVL